MTNMLTIDTSIVILILQLLWYDHPIHVILISQIPYKKFKHLYMYMYTCYISKFSIFLVYNFHFVLI